MFVQWVKDKKGLGAFLKQTEIERVTNDDNLFWNSPLRPLSSVCFAIQQEVLGKNEHKE